MAFQAIVMDKPGSLGESDLVDYWHPATDGHYTWDDRGVETWVFLDPEPDGRFRPVAILDATSASALVMRSTYPRQTWPELK